MQLKRKLVSSSPAEDEPNNHSQRQHSHLSERGESNADCGTTPEPAPPASSTKPAARVSPRKIRLGRRLHNNHSDTIADANSPLNPDARPLSQQSQKPPDDAVVENSSIDQRQLSGMEPQQQPDLLTSVLTAKKLSMMRDPAVVDFFRGIICRSNIGCGNVATSPTAAVQR